MRWSSSAALTTKSRSAVSVIELGEIESVLLQHASVKQAVVMAKDDERGDKRLVAYVVGDRDIAAEDIGYVLKAELPDFMVPSTIVVLPRIPLTSNGKIDRQALPEPEAVENRVFIAPKTEAEVIVSKIFAEVLRRDRVSTDDNFFDSGGHSSWLLKSYRGSGALPN